MVGRVRSGRRGSHAAYVQLWGILFVISASSQSIQTSQRYQNDLNYQLPLEIPVIYKDGPYLAWVDVCACPPPTLRSSWSALLWESDIPIDLWLPRECVCMCAPRAYTYARACVSAWCSPSCFLNIPVQQTTGDKRYWIMCNSATFWRQYELQHIYGL